MRSFPLSPFLTGLLPPAALSPRGLALALIGLLLIAFVPPLVFAWLTRKRRLEPNYRHELIPQSFGLVILIGASALLAATALLFPATRRMCGVWLLCVIGFGTLGFLDDTWGNKRIKGLRGHFHATLRQRTITTGFLKAGGGGLLALLLGYLTAPGSLTAALLAAALIALCANAVNLLDLRPGRAGAVFLVLSFVLLGVCLAYDRQGAWPLVYVVLPTLPVWIRDARAKVMMGDTGSNLLGAGLGLAFVQAKLPLPAQIVAVVFLVALHVLAERVSLTAVIERSRLLRSLDRLTGVRSPSPPAPSPSRGEGE